MGQGEKPGWFLQDKYKSVTEQAKAYPELSKRFGSFAGAPKDEKGEVKYDTSKLKDQFNFEHPLMQGFTKWAGESNLNQEGFNQLLESLYQYEAAQVPNMAQIKASIGENADERISAVAAWGKANLGTEYDTLRQAMTGKEAARVFAVVEKIMGKTTQTRMPKPGEDTRGAGGPDGLEAIRTAHAAKMPDGRFRKDVDPAYAKEIDDRYRKYFASLEG
jgi:hypothetical protein